MRFPFILFFSQKKVGVKLLFSELITRYTGCWKNFKTVLITYFIENNRHLFLRFSFSSKYQLRLYMLIFRELIGFSANIADIIILKKFSLNYSYILSLNYGLRYRTFRNALIKKISFQCSIIFFHSYFAY